MLASLRVLSPDDIELIHAATCQILQHPGIKVLHPEAREMFLGAGAVRREDAWLSIAEPLIHEALQSLPSSLRLYDRKGDPAIDTSDKRPYFGTGLFCGQILDHQTHRIRPFSSEDLAPAARICDRLPNLHLIGSLGLPADLPAEQAPLAATDAIMQHTDKPVIFYAYSPEQARELWSAVARRSGGWAALKKTPSALDLIGPTSPLCLDEQACQRLIHNGRHALPTACYSALIPGASGPVTLAGAMAQAAAESLAGIILNQLAGPGAPVITGSVILTMDLRKGSLAYSSPEYCLACQAAAEYFAYLGISTWSGAGHSDAHSLDLQAASELGMNLSLAAMSDLSSGSQSGLPVIGPKPHPWRCWCWAMSWLETPGGCARASR